MVALSGLFSHSTSGPLARRGRPCRRPHPARSRLGRSPASNSPTSCTSRPWT